MAKLPEWLPMNFSSKPYTHILDQWAWNGTTLRLANFGSLVCRLESDKEEGDDEMKREVPTDFVEHDQRVLCPSLFRSITLTPPASFPLQS